MAAYAALLSVMHTIDQIKLHPHPPIYLDKTQVESLTENVTFLQKFLENYSQKFGYRREADPLEMRIANAAYAAEDVIESRILDQIHGGKISSDEFCYNLEKVIEEMECIKKDVMEIKDKTELIQDQVQRNSVPARKNSMMGFDEILIELLDKLTGGRIDRRIIPIVGMGGIGKTTLARNVYENRVVVHHFDVLVWVTVSQDYKMGEILLQLLQKGGGNSGVMDEYELGYELHKRLSGRRYLIVLDDLWDIEVWEQLSLFFPDNKNGSRIMLTTRISNLASRAADSGGIQMSFLIEENCWDLFSDIVFGGEGCPLELEDVGRRIVRNCGGLPLSIVVIGGLLAKSEHTREYWEYIEENLNSVVNSEEECCLRILHMSYSRLPVYLKPCFLYMGVFEEDRAISVSTLVKLWVAEGFVKPVSAKSLDDVAKEYLKELIDRNLILVHALGSTGNVKSCNIHDLLRDLCLREAHRDGFYNVVSQRNGDLAQRVNTQRRIVIPTNQSNEEVLDALQPMPLARSLICDLQRNSLLPDFRMLRILRTYDDHHLQSADVYFPEKLFMFVNSRYLAVRASRLPSSIHLLWNLQTLIVHSFDKITAPAVIWNMSQLRHVKCKFGGLFLPDPSEGDNVLQNIQTLGKVINFAFSEEVVRRIPNIKKLRVSYEGELDGRLSYCPDNLNRLHKLESFYYSFMPRGDDFLQNLTFPRSLKKLSLEASFSFMWQDIMENIGTLPLLEKLRLSCGAFRENKWETVEGQFHSLKSLDIDCYYEYYSIPSEPLVYWITESSHFPRLEQLVLQYVTFLEEIPSDIGEIPTLKSIVLDNCSLSTIVSAKKILEEQEELGEVGFRIRVFRDVELRNEALESMASPNFQVEWIMN